ncbi:MAG TPA: hypothetical protein VMZ04_09770, partial [Anaerolineae bacterium]|nr:hypothetical protein [Anaerolineae bacterium]
PSTFKVYSFKIFRLDMSIHWQEVRKDQKGIGRLTLRIVLTCKGRSQSIVQEARYDRKIV